MDNDEMTRNGTICFAVLMAFSACAWAAQKSAPKPRGKTETLTCQLGTEDRHARIAVVLVGGKTDSFAYYSKWKPRTCSIHLQRSRDPYSKWIDNGNVTTISIEKGSILVEHEKGAYRFVFREVDRERYCGIDGKINGSLTVRKGQNRCELEGVMEEGVPLGQAFKDVPNEARDPAPESAPVTEAPKQTGPEK